MCVFSTDVEQPTSSRTKSVSLPAELLDSRINKCQICLCMPNMLVFRIKQFPAKQAYNTYCSLISCTLLIEPSNRAILVVSSSKEMLPPLPSVDSAVLVSSSAEESSCVEKQRYLFVSLRSKPNSNTGQVLQW